MSIPDPSGTDPSGTDPAGTERDDVPVLDPRGSAADSDAAGERTGEGPGAEPATEPDVGPGAVGEDELATEVADDDGMAEPDDPAPASRAEPGTGDDSVGADSEAGDGPTDRTEDIVAAGDGTGADSTDVTEDVDAADVTHDVVDDDADLDAWDDGSDVVGPGGSLPFVVSAREEFAALGEVERTGDARVDAATARLAEVAELPVADHVAVYDDVHRRLQDALADADVR
ncbi:MAG: hypothetical protein GC157_01725 [Frankiales bacterium]|nr:hypothetical protein [Frankiales bacterium]